MTLSDDNSRDDYGFGTTTPGWPIRGSLGKTLTVHAARLSPHYAWRWSIAPGCYFQVERAPNRFHRFMQRVFLGLKWERNDVLPPAREEG